MIQIAYVVWYYLVHHTSELIKRPAVIPTQRATGADISSVTIETVEDNDCYTNTKERERGIHALGTVLNILLRLAPGTQPARQHKLIAPIHSSYHSD